ncbi:MAG TPA: tripartite tricarboxylate transporter substrate binding protein [Burkholderiales bacterium]|nr:tripartite tricarboxylate transporter substrate binding protein [Burkholderiales bacterium]
MYGLNSFGMVLVLLALAGVATAQSWPAKSVKVIVPFVPGGTADTLGRIVSAKLSESFGQSFVVENRGGAGGMVGAEAVSRSTPDGYTLGVTGLGPLPIATAIVAKPPYDPVKDFAHVALFGGPPSVLAVHPSVPARNIEQFIALTKSQPAAINYGTAGNGSTGQLLAELFKQKSGARMQHIAYKGASGAVVDVIAGHIQAVSTTLTTTSAAMRSGRVRAIAISSAERLPDFPEVPTFRESGYPELVAAVWFSLSAPPGTPAEIISKLNADVRRILHLADVRERLRPEGIETNNLDPRGFTEFVAAEVRRWGPLVRASGARHD